jgi:hypothetical protein
MAMKKDAWLIAVGLFILSVIVGGCATTPMEKAAVTLDALPTLKGKWSGWTTFSSFPGNSVRTTLEINNDRVPLHGMVILHRLPEAAEAFFPIRLENVSADNSVTIFFRNAKITESGTILGTKGDNFLELTYYVGEKKQRFDGKFYFYGGKGDFTATKD